VWPALLFASDGETVAFLLRDTLSAGQPIRYLRNAEGSVSASAFERAVDELMTLLLERLAARRAPIPDLAGLWEEVRTERLDPSMAARRKREALLGLDPDMVSAEEMDVISAGGAWMGEAALEETMASARVGQIRATIDRLKAWSMEAAPDLDLSAVDPASGRWRAARHEFAEPWQRGAALAEVLRQEIGLSSLESVPSEKLAALLGHDVTADQALGGPMAAGFRALASPLRLKYFPKRHHPISRRFEVARLLADVLDGPAKDAVLPVTECSTARQKVQRSFAQEFLCPIGALRQRLPLPNPSDVDIEEAAHHFQVSEFMVRSALVNRGLVDRGYLPLG
jgi:hypothetical protein